MKEAMKKIIIFTSTGGGGHLSVSNALIENLSVQYRVIPSLILGEVLKPIDPVRTMSFGYFNFEGLYNALLKKGWYRNSTTDAGLIYFKIRQAKIRRLIREYLVQESPDMILSVIPLFNSYILEAAQELNIPFVLVPTDLDAKTFLRGITQPTFNLFRLAIAFDHPLTTQKMCDNKIPSRLQAVTGFPLKKTFNMLKNNDEIKQIFGIPAGKKVIMILMGAQGSKASLGFAQELADFDRPVHLLFCLGKNETVKKVIEQMIFQPQVSVSCIGFTSAIADLMSIADVIITKSGSVSVCEAIYMNLPLILDATGPLLTWEKLNHQFVEEMGFGISLKNRADLKGVLTSLLEYNKLAQLKRNLKKLDKKNGVEQIQKLISKMLEPEIIDQAISLHQQHL